MARGIMVVAASPAEGREDDFNDWYSNEHIPQVLTVPGFVSARRYKLHSGKGQRYLAVYELEAEDLRGPVTALRSQQTPDRERGAEVLATDPAPEVSFYERID